MMGSTSQSSRLTVFIIAFIFQQTKAQTDECLSVVCPNGWISYDGSCYLFADNMLMSWDNATQYCSSFGASLAVIQTHGEDQMIIDQANRLYKPCSTTTETPYFWVGANDREVEGTWVWYPGNQPLTYTNWSPQNNEPDNVGEQDCGLLFGPYGFAWGSGSCETTGHFICEKNGTTSP